MRNNILFITLSNIGDAMLALPVLDILKDKYPDSRITVLASERSEVIFNNDPSLERVIIYNKACSLAEKFKLIKDLRKDYFDLIVDLRNSAFPILLRAKRKTTPLDHILKKNRHITNWHIAKLRRIIKEINFNAKRQSFYVDKDSSRFIMDKLQELGIKDGSFVALAVGARSYLKCWDKDKFLVLCRRIIEELNLDLVLIGDAKDKPVCDYIQGSLKRKVFNLTGQTTLKQLAALLLKSKLLIANDSGIIHLASYLNVPILGLYGPTDYKKYGPWSVTNIVARINLDCAPCEKAHCRFDEVKCLTRLDSDFVFGKLNNLINEL